LALHFLKNEPRRLRHHLLHDVAQTLLALFELRDQLREHCEVSLLGLGTHGAEPAVHGLHEAAMRRRDLSVEGVARRPALRHGRSIESRVGRFNAVAGVLLLAAACARAADVPGVGHVTASGYLDGRAIADTGDGPRQRPQLLGDVALQATPWSAVTMRLETR